MEVGFFVIHKIIRKKIKMVNRFFYFIIFISITLVSCDCEFSYEFKILNETAEPISIEFNHDGNHSNFTLTPSEQISILQADGFRCGCSGCTGSRVHDIDTTVNYLLSEIRITKSDTVETILDFNYEYNWEFESKKKLGIYLARIDDSDF